MPATAVVAVAVVAGVALTPDATAANRDPKPETRAKGGATLELFVDGPEPEHVEVVRPGSRLRLRFDPGGHRHARVLWASPDGRLDALHPAVGEPSLNLLDPHGPRWMDYTIELDAESADEALVAVFCDAPFDHRAALAHAGSETCTVARLPVPKVR